jgi:catechol 2,3-dioxygenase-like lactoylglutathione lyase family enzyme
MRASETRSRARARPATKPHNSTIRGLPPLRDCANKGHQPRELHMSTTEVRSEPEVAAARALTVDLKLEVVAIPVAEVDRAKRFYGGLGWRLDADFVRGDALRIVQFTPPGSACSIHFGVGVTSAAPGSAQGLYLVVSDIETARTELAGRGVEVSEVFHRHADGLLSGPDPARRSYNSFVSFSDPDGNGWLVQEVTARLPGRVDAGNTRFASSAELASALRRAAAAHGEHEKRIRAADPNGWPDWYAEYIVREQAGEALPS